MISNRPHLLRAFHQWIIDSECTPILVIDTKHPQCKIPQDYVEGGEIVFNISPSAIRDLKITNQMIEFKASFSGVIHIISAPIKSVMAIYAEENGEGIFFDAEEDEEGEGKSVLRLKEVEKSSSQGSSDSVNVGMVNKSKPVLKLVE